MPKLAFAGKSGNSLHDFADREISMAHLGGVRIVTFVGLSEGVVMKMLRYNGYSAMLVIACAIGETLRRHGVNHFRPDTRLWPTWTTDRKLKDKKETFRRYLIAPSTGSSIQHQIIEISAISCQRSPEENKMEGPIVTHREHGE